jgi:hypothetical protein
MIEQMTRLLDEKEGNEVVRWLKNNGPTDMNGLAYQDFPQKDEEQFAMLIGYSVSGAGDLSYFSGAMINRADIIAAKMADERDAK